MSGRGVAQRSPPALQQRFSVICAKASTGAEIIFAVRSSEREALIDVTRLQALGIQSRAAIATAADVPGLQRRLGPR